VSTTYQAISFCTAHGHGFSTILGFVAEQTQLLQATLYHFAVYGYVVGNEYLRTARIEFVEYHPVAKFATTILVNVFVASK
jgi:hypothetical protein